jgi:hypothetical protein
MVSAHSVQNRPFPLIGLLAACAGLAYGAGWDLAGLEIASGTARAADLAAMASQPLGEGEAFRPVSDAALQASAAKVRAALGPLETLLARSASGDGWKKYLDWPALVSQAADGRAADPAVLRRLHALFDSGENGLEMHQFAAVRRAVAAYAEAAEAARNPEAVAAYNQALEKLAAAVAAGAATGTAEPLDPVGPLLSKLEASGQAPRTIARVRGAVSRPNLYLDVDENLLGSAVNRVVDQVAPVNELVLSTRVRGSGHTTGLVLLDFVPSSDRATIDLRLDATNRSNTSGTQGPVTVHTLGTTKVGARKRILLDDRQVRALPVEAHASTDTRTAGISVGNRFGKNLIRRIASRKIAEVRPRAEAITEQKTREQVRRQFEEQTSSAIAKAAGDYQTKFRRPLLERGWYPELLAMSTSDSRLSVTARKALPDQIAAFTSPPAVDPDAVMAVRVHETLVNNAAEITLGGRTITQQFVEEQIKKNNATVPESLANDPDQPPWSITFAKRKPVELDADDGRVKLTVRGSRFTSGDREFPSMDIWAAYRMEPSGGGTRLVRDGDVQIYPPGFVPGGGEKLTIAETSLRRILQKRFNKVFKEVIDVEPMQLPGELAGAGPLPVEQMLARKDGWVAVGWRKRDPVIWMSEVVSSDGPVVAAEPTLAAIR